MSADGGGTDTGTGYTYYDLSGKRVWVAGHRGLVGGAIVRRLADEPCEVLTAGRERADLRRQAEVEDWLAEARPHAVVLAAAKVGGILANDRYPADFLQDNLLMETNVIAAAQKLGVEKLVFLGSSCIYPKHAQQPLTEDALLTGPLEPTNEWYAVAKIAGIKLCQAHRRQHGCDFVSAMPTNLFGPHDNFHPEHSHVIPALLRRFHEAKVNGDRQVTVWGTGTPMREFLYVDDCADAVVHLLKHYSGERHLNVGTGTDVTIRELAETVKRVVGFDGELVWDTDKPDGTPRKVMDVSRLHALGWRARTDLETGLARTYDWYLRNIDQARAV
jgi:GDP-L-fucose synthase